MKDKKEINHKNNWKKTEKKHDEIHASVAVRHLHKKDIIWKWVGRGEGGGGREGGRKS